MSSDEPPLASVIGINNFWTTRKIIFDVMKLLIKTTEKADLAKLPRSAMCKEVINVVYELVVSEHGQHLIDFIDSLGTALYRSDNAGLDAAKPNL